MVRWSVLVVLVCMLAVCVTPAFAEVIPINPRETPEVVLSEEEAAKLKALQLSSTPILYSDVSPDDTSVVVISLLPTKIDFAFVNINDGSRVAIDLSIQDYGPFSEFRWRDNNTIVYLSATAGLGPLLVTIDKNSGALATTSITVPGFPLSLSPDGGKLLLAIEEEVEAEQSGPASLANSPFDIQLPRGGYRQPGLPRHSYDDPAAQAWADAVQDDVGTLQASSTRIGLVSYDIGSGEAVPLITLPELSIPVGLAWTRDGSTMALVRTTVDELAQPERGPGGRPGDRLASLLVQDSLGALAPADNPLLQGNVVDIFEIDARNMRVDALRAAEHGSGGTFVGVDWSSDGNTLLAQLDRPSVLAGREYPVFFQPQSTFMQFYGRDGQLLNTLERPEIDAPLVTGARWASPDEVIINTITGLSGRMYYYNRVSGEFRSIPIPDGSYFEARSTNLSRRLVFMMMSWQQPFEIFSVGWDGQALAGLTWWNEELKALNRVRADYVSFTLANGEQRAGFLVQPADAPFPPQNVPIVVWQEGGPTAPMAQYFGNRVESPHNLLPNFGIAVLHVPLPGRLGFGAQFLNAMADGTNFGQLDIDQGAEIVGQLIARGWTSSSKIGVAGCSYGGYFASQSLTRYPELYAAANSQCTLLDLFSEFQYGYTGYISYLEGRTPFTDPDEIALDSPINRAANVRTPLLLFNGALDFLPIGITRNFHDQVELNGVPVDLYVFAREGHGLSLANSQFVAGQQQILWFREYLNE